MRIVIGVISMLVVCACSRSTPKPEAPKPATVQVKEEAPPEPYTPSLSDILGQWYVVATNPAFNGSVITDYIHWEFLPEGKVMRTTRNEHETRVERGTYTWSSGDHTLVAVLDVGEGSQHELTWTFVSPGLAAIVRFRNPSIDYERESREEFVRQDTSEWKRRRKKAINLPKHTIADNTSLAPKNGRRVQVNVVNADLTRRQCHDLINEYRAVAAPEGQVSVHVAFGK